VTNLIKELDTGEKIKKTYQSILDGKSIPKFFMDRYKNDGDEVAFRYKDLGIYKEVTWKQYWKEVEEFCLGLLELGLEKGDRVAIMGDSCAEWLYADLAILSAGGISFGIYSTSSPEETCYTIEKTEAKLFIAENQEYVDKILPFVDQFPFLKKVIVIDTRAMFMYRDPRLISFASVQELGQRSKAENLDQFCQLIEVTRGDRPAFLVFTSGTTGAAKPAMITHKGILASLVYASSEIFPKLLTHEQRSISHLSLAHIVERAYSIYFPLIYDWKPHIGEKVDYLQETLFEVRPTFFHGVPRIWEKFAAQILVGIESSAWVKKRTFSLAMRIGWKYMRMRWKGERIPVVWRLLYWVAFQICFRHILHQVGLNKAEYIMSTGAPLPPQIQRLWQVWGLDLINQYGSTETSGIISSQQVGFPEPGDLGKPTSINRVALADDGEILVGGPGVFPGYWNDVEKTQEIIRNGWLYMGEIFEYTQDRNLRMIDRKKDIMVTSGGKNIAPTFIENAIEASPYISKAVVFADGRKFPCALIEIDFDTVADWARRNKVLYTGFTSLTDHPEINSLIAKEVVKANQTLARVEQVKKFRIIPQELDPEAGETTPTRKIKRTLMYKMFGHLVEEMYKSKETEILENLIKEG
jgi:long-chain acyl-CoA synthetase